MCRVTLRYAEAEKEYHQRSLIEAGQEAMKHKYGCKNTGPDMITYERDRIDRATCTIKKEKRTLAVNCRRIDGDCNPGFYSLSKYTNLRTCNEFAWVPDVDTNGPCWKKELTGKFCHQPLKFTS